MRIAVGLEYEGTRYAGWQTQRSAEAVQGLVEGALTQVAAEPVSLVCAGRTGNTGSGIGIGVKPTGSGNVFMEHLRFGVAA